MGNSFKLKRYVAKFRGLAPNRILFIDNSNLFYFEINKFQFNYTQERAFDKPSNQSPKLKAGGARGCWWWAK